jgi:hypothetical protein
MIQFKLFSIARLEVRKSMQCGMGKKAMDKVKRKDLLPLHHVKHTWLILHLCKKLAITGLVSLS